MCDLTSSTQMIYAPCPNQFQLMDLILLHFCVEYKSLKSLHFKPQFLPEQIEMKVSTSIFVLSTVVSVCSGMGFTALDIDNHPCKPENLKVYLCQLLA